MQSREVVTAPPADAERVGEDTGTIERRKGVSEHIFEYLCRMSSTVQATHHEDKNTSG